jgi:hypothetical protein
MVMTMQNCTRSVRIHVPFNSGTFNLQTTIDTGPANYFGAAISVQLIGMKQNDQEFTIIASAVDSILRGQ